MALHRFGDTSFRIANQVNFYTELINKIIQFKSEHNTIDAKEIFEKLIEDGVINYNKEEIDRTKLMLKLFCESDLLTSVNGQNNIYTLTNKFIEMIDYLNDDSLSNNYYTNVEVLFSYILLANNTHGERMVEFINYLVNKIDSNNNIVNEIELASFISDNDFARTVSDTYGFDRKQFLQYVYKLNFNENEIIELLRNLENAGDNQNNVLSNFLVRHDLLPFKKPPTTIFKTLELLNYVNDNNFNNIATNYLLNEEFGVKKIICKIAKIFYDRQFRPFNRNIDNVIGFIIDKKYELVSKVFLLKKYELFFKDYMDINERWFTNIGLLSTIQNNNGNSDLKLYSINENILDLFKFIIDNDYVNKSFNNYVIELNKQFTKNREQEIVYPFTYNEVVSLLEDYKENKLSEMYDRHNELKNIGNSTIYEYLVNLAIAYAYDYNVDDFRHKFCRTKLDHNLLPSFTAAGKGPDGYIEDVDNGHVIFSTVESTIHKNLEAIIDNERSRIFRHCYDYCKEQNQEEKIVMFVVDTKLSDELLHEFCSHAMTRYYKDRKTNIRVILLTTDIFTKLFSEQKLNRVIRSFMNRIPINDDEFAREKDILKWYRQQMESIRR